MSLYNMVCGFNPACVWLLPMLGKKHTEYPRFRDCFLSEDGKIRLLIKEQYNDNELMHAEVRYEKQ